MRKKINAYLQLMRFDRPVGFVLLLWPVLWGVSLGAGGHVDLKVLVILIVGVFVTRSMGCVINDVIDCKFDAQVLRTQHRPLACGLLTKKEAVFLFLVLVGAAFFLVCLLNKLTIALAFIAMPLVVFYPWVKRFWNGPQFVLGLTFGGLPVLMAFSAVSNRLMGITLLLGVAACCWTIAYDTLYGLSDQSDDARLGIKSTVFLFGKYVAWWVALFQSSMLLLLVILGYTHHFNASFYISLMVVSVFFIYQLMLIRHRAPAACLSAFRNNQWVGGIILLGLVFGS